MMYPPEFTQPAALEADVARLQSRLTAWKRAGWTDDAPQVRAVRTALADVVSLRIALERLPQSVLWAASNPPANPPA